MSDKARKIFLPLAIILFGALIMVLLVKAYPDAEQLPPQAYQPLVSYQLAEKMDTRITIHSQGTVMPRTESNIISQVAGQIVYTSNRFASGGFFEKGEVMLRIDPSDYKLAKTVAELQVAQAELRLAREEEEAKLAQDEWSSIGAGQASDLVLRKPQLSEAKAGLGAAQAGLEMADLNLKRTEIKAPYNCIVRRKMADVGQVVSMGFAIANIYAIDFVEIRLPLPDADIAFVDIPFQFKGMQKEGSPDVLLSAVFAGEELSWQGSLIRLEGEIDARSRMVNGVARVENPYGKGLAGNYQPLAVGMFVTARIEGKLLQNVYVIDRAALRDNNKLWIIDDAQKLYLRDVNVIRLESEKVIIGSGINEGEKICLTALDAMVDGMEVKLNN